MISAPPQIPSYSQGFARCRGDSTHPQPWDGLVGWWAPFLGPAGLALHDWSGHGNHGTLTDMDAGSDWVPSSYGWGLDFDGVNDGVLIGDRPRLKFTTEDFSLAARIYVRNTTSIQVFMGKGRVGGGFFPYIFWIYDNYFRLLVANAAGTAAKTSLVAIPAANRWYHLVAVKQGTMQYLYLDGVLGDSDASWAEIKNDSCDFVLGREHGGLNPFNGQLAAAAVWARALSPTEITAAYADPFALLRPRRQFTAIVPAIGGPYRTATGQAFHTGADAGKNFNTGQTAGQIDGRCG